MFEFLCFLTSNLRTKLSSRERDICGLVRYLFLLPYFNWIKLCHTNESSLQCGNPAEKGKPGQSSLDITALDLKGLVFCFLTCMCVCVHVLAWEYTSWTTFRSSFHPSCELWESNSCCRCWWQAPPPSSHLVILYHTCYTASNFN